jgi:hypothetical protein
VTVNDIKGDVIGARKVRFLRLEKYNLPQVGCHGSLFERKRKRERETKRDKERQRERERGREGGREGGRERERERETEGGGEREGGTLVLLLLGVCWRRLRTKHTQDI